MKSNLYVHIGPYKTGTTSVQEHFWKNRANYLAEGLLYPKTGVAAKNWGHRHLHLAKSFKPKLWESLLQEIGEADVPKVLLSAERFSADLSHLAKAKDLIAAYDPKLIIVLRDEVDLIRSMYLQAVKSYFSKPGKRFEGRVNFTEWWSRSGPKFAYGRMLQQWGDAFGDDTIIYLKYQRGSSFDIVGEMCSVLDVPVLKRTSNMNPSISAFAARNAILASRLGWKVGRRVMRLSHSIERRFESLRKAPPAGFDPKAIRDYYLERNREALDRFPEFARMYREMHSSHIA